VCSVQNFLNYTNNGCLSVVELVEATFPEEFDEVRRS
jgi:hypothetical protein